MTILSDDQQQSVSKLLPLVTQQRYEDIIANPHAIVAHLYVKDYPEI